LSIIPDNAYGATKGFIPNKRRQSLILGMRNFHGCISQSLYADEVRYRAERFFITHVGDKSIFDLPAISQVFLEFRGIGRFMLVSGNK
jgi:hypothetical protein